MTEPGLWTEAARCYEMAGALAEAARCYRAGGAARQAGDLYAYLGQHHAAAEAHAAAGLVHAAAWRLAHLAGDPDAARTLLANPDAAGEPVDAFLGRLVVARCDIASPSAALAVLVEAQELLAGDVNPLDPHVEEWSVALAETMRRYDQVALLYAAAVRGGRPGAVQRWKAWTSARFGTVIVVPDDPARGVRP